MFVTVVLHCWVTNTEIVQTEIFQNQIRDLAIQLPPHLMTVEHLNPLFAFEPKDLSMLHCSSFLQYENMLISQLCYPLHFRKKN